MNHDDHVNLLRRGVPAIGGIWADFGCGAGAFTLALAELIVEGTIHAIDKDAGALRVLEDEMRLPDPRLRSREAGTEDRGLGRRNEDLGRRFPRITLHTHRHDYTKPIALPALDGLVAANTLHFHRDKLAIVRSFKAHLREGGRMLLVEYNIDAGNTAVPHPLPFSAWQTLTAQAGFAHTELMMTRPSRFLKEIYSAVSC